MKHVDDGVRVVVETASGADTWAYEYVVQQVWDYESTTVTDTVYEPLRGGDAAFENVAGEGEISVVYASERNGDWRYLFDLSVPSSVRERLVEEIRTDEGDGESNYYERSFEDDGIQIRWGVQRDGDSPLTLTIPYSLYAMRRNEDRNDAFDFLPTQSSNDYSPYVHHALTETLQSDIENADGGDGSANSDGRPGSERTDDRRDRGFERYRIAETISEFAQSIPHALDRQSKGQWNYIRTPEECLAELTADCKDASLLIYHLLGRFGYDPELLYIIGDSFTDVEAVSETVRDAPESGVPSGFGNADNDDLYENHLAVAVPQRDLEPIPPEVREDVTPIEHDGKAYLYVESTSVYSPGVIPDSLEDNPMIVY